MKPDMQPVWLKEFQTFEDKASALSLDTGVSEQLAGMIRKCICPGQTLAVGKPEYVTIIESNLVSVAFPCLLTYVNNS
uniref:Uncharacterized protein n=1 Tax=Oryza punctata TaxID=4537 RepID=A0A0E0LQH5_ORYPU